jgi:hypothetical protein
MQLKKLLKVNNCPLDESGHPAVKFADKYLLDSNVQSLIKTADKYLSEFNE